MNGLERNTGGLPYSKQQENEQGRGARAQAMRAGSRATWPEARICGLGSVSSGLRPPHGYDAELR